MKIKTLLLAIVLAVSFGVVLAPRAEARVTFSYFYDSLQPYGDWVDVDNYGYCWQPRGMDADWRPYTDGYWSYTDAGWTWVSYEDFGSITYHYGRWIRLEDFGWVWKPDYEWGPAWVSWRQSDDYIGWAPLPPDAVFEPDTGIGVWVDRDYDIGPSAYAFCEYRYFGAPVIRNFLIPRQRNFAIINSTVNITNITVLSGPGQSRMVFNGGLDYRRIAERSEHRIATLELVRRTDGDWAQHHRSELSRQVGNQLIINAPEVEASKTRFAPAKVTQQIHTPKIDKGWVGVADPAEKQRIQQRYHDQTRGLTRATAPAITVNAGQVQTMMNDARTHQRPAAAAQTQQAAQVQQQAQQPSPAQKEHSRHAEQGAATQSSQQSKIQQVEQPQQTQQPSPAQKDHSRHAEQGAATQSSQQPKVQQEQPIEQQRKAADAQARTARDQEQAQRGQQQAEQQRKAADAQARTAARDQEQAQRGQQQAEQQRKAADAQARATRDQEQAQRGQQQAEQQRKAADAQARVQQEGQRRQQEQPAKQHAQPQVQPQAQGQAQQSPSPDGKKKHKDDTNTP